MWKICTVAAAQFRSKSGHNDVSAQPNEGFSALGGKNIKQKQDILTTKNAATSDADMSVQKIIS